MALPELLLLTPVMGAATGRYKYYILTILPRLPPLRPWLFPRRL